MREEGLVIVKRVGVAVVVLDGRVRVERVGAGTEVGEVGIGIRL